MCVCMYDKKNWIYIFTRHKSIDKCFMFIWILTFILALLKALSFTFFLSRALLSFCWEFTKRLTISPLFSVFQSSHFMNLHQCSYNFHWWCYYFIAFCASMKCVISVEIECKQEHYLYHSEYICIILKIWGWCVLRLMMEK